MNTNSLPKIVFAPLLALTLISCTGASQRAQVEAGERMGVAAARVTLAEQPAECAIDTPHAVLTEGQSSVVALRREREQLNSANGSKRRCYQFNENQRVGLERSQ